VKPDVVAFPGPFYPMLAPADSGYIDPNDRVRGNSFSGPHGAGVAALMLSAAPKLPAWRVKEILEKTAKEIGFPVAIKLIAAEVIHKTESGAVMLGVKNAEEAQAEGQKLLTKTLGRGHLLIQEMVQGTEVLIGARTDPQYGPFLMVGLGGIFVEVLKDVSIRLLPVDEREAREMLKELRGYKVLEGVRGQKPRDVDALVKAMVGLSEIFAGHRNHLSDMEINPMMVREQGRGAVAVDVRLVRK